MKFRKKPVVIEATQWFKNGDHPLDYSRTHDGLENGEPRQFSPEERKANNWEGDIVRYYRHPEVPGERTCMHCEKIMHDHGWIETLEGGHIVCPEDWIITGVQGEMYPCKPDIFAATYEPAEQADNVSTAIRNLRCIAKTVLRGEERATMRADLEAAAKLLANAQTTEQQSDVAQPVTVSEIIEAVANFVGSQKGGPFTPVVIKAAIIGQLEYGDAFTKLFTSPASPTSPTSLHSQKIKQRARDALSAQGGER